MDGGHVRFKPCLLVAAVFLLLSVPILVWLGQDGAINEQRYWSSQVNWFIYFNQICSSNERIWSNLTQLGDALILLPLLSFFTFARPAIWAAFFGSIPLATLLTHGGKAWAAIPRPAAVLDETLFNIVGEQLTGHNSLPSGHTATIFVVGTVVMLSLFFANRRPSRWFVLFSVMTLTVTLAVSRVAVGAHWPLDIFFGALCGYLGGLSGLFFTQRFTHWWSWIKRTEYQAIVGILLLLWSLSLIPALQTTPPEASVIYWFAAIVGTSSALLLIIRASLNRQP